MADWLAELNEPQRQAVEHEGSPLLVIAGAGSGKTRVITYRVARLIRERGVAPWNVLAVTFTNKAAAEMKERVTRLVGEHLDSRLQIATFHSTCAGILRREAHRAGLSSNFTICDEGDQRVLVREVMRDLGIDKNEVQPSQAQWIINQAKMRMLEPADVGKVLKSMYEEQYIRIYERYEQVLRTNDACDFEDLILRCVRLFEGCEEARLEWAGRWPHVLVDEYQDTNHVQFRFLEALSRDTRQLCVVGDEDQSIYSWRGAEIDNLLDFQKHFPEARLVKLEQNYRSHANILNAAGRVIERNTERLGKKLWTERPPGPPLYLIDARTDREEMLRVTTTLQDLHDNHGLPYREMAVFYRANSLSRGMEDRLREWGIPHRVVGAMRFYDRKEIKDLLSYMKTVANPNNSIALMRVINTPRRGIGQKTQDLAMADSMNHNRTVFQSLRAMLKAKAFPAAATKRLGEFIKLLEAWRRDAPHLGPADLLERILDGTDFLKSLGDEKAFDVIARKENIDELKNSMAEYENEHPNAQLDDYLEMVSLASSLDTMAADDDVISLMTVHAAKGLEFSVVFVIGLDNTVFPTFRAIESGNLEEERRLFYVALTRAKDLVVLSRADSRFYAGRQAWCKPSMFLRELPKELLEPIDELDAGQIAQFATHRQVDPAVAEAALDDDNFAKRPEFRRQEAARRKERLAKKKEHEAVRRQTATAAASQFHPGDRVEHPLLGPAEVIAVDPSGEDYRLTLLLNDGAEQTIYARFANLKKLTFPKNSI